jgi:hypothetical protein
MIKQFFRNHYLSLILTAIVIIITIVNYAPGTYLSGWDNLQTDLNPLLGIKRAFFGVWQEYQSFGLVAGMAHAADLPRAVFVYLISFVLPQNIIRYFFHSLMILVGGLGMMKLLEQVGFKNYKKVLAFLGALFYVLNFGTIQIFSMPFESFSIFFAALPWQIWIFFKLIEHGTLNIEHMNLKNLLMFFIINLLATPYAVSQQLFIVYLLILAVLTIELIIQNRNIKIIKTSAMLFLLLLLINSFWILPQIYFLKTNGYVINEAKINQISSSEIYYQNLEKGNLKDFLTFKGFFYDQFTKNNEPIFTPWKAYFNNTAVKVIIVVMTALPLVGLLTISNYQLPFIFVYFLIALALLTNTPPFSWINNLIRLNPFINQIFRSPFTKFIVPYSLVASYFFTAGIETLSKIITHRASRSLFFVLCSMLILIYAFPAFQGNLFSREMKVKIPQEYFQLMDYMTKQDKNKRVALLPEYTYWGWLNYKWGYNGSGFLWYGIEQPIVSRNFDMWSSKSESYYWEMKNALDANDQSGLNNVLNKYAVDYLIVDYSLQPISGSYKALDYSQIENLLGQNPAIKLVKSWKNIKLYQVSHPYAENNFLNIINDVSTVGPSLKYNFQDTAYIDNGNYVSGNNYDYNYPFLDLASDTRIKDKKWRLYEDNNYFIVEAKIDFYPNNYDLVWDDPYYRAWITADDGSIKETVISPQIEYRDSKLVVRIPKIKLSNFNVISTEIDNCAKNGNSKMSYPQGNLQIKSLDGATGCFGYNQDILSQQYSYLVKINNQNIQGQRFFFYVLDQTKQKTYLEDRLQNDLEYYLLPAKDRYGLGYQIVFHNNSYINLPSENKLKQLEIYLFPFDLLKNIKFVKTGYINQNSLPVSNPLIKTEKANYFIYKAEINPKLISNSQYLVLSQAFDQGWKAYANGKEIKGHVMVNNWANGWKIDNRTLNIEHRTMNITIVFWPQYLEYIGFGLMLIALCYIIFLYAHAIPSPNQKS